MYTLQEDEDVFDSISEKLPTLDKETEKLIVHLNEVLQNEDISKENIDKIKSTLRNRTESKQFYGSLS